jgi:hypothetical protein
LVTLLRGLGIDISKREVVRLLTAGHDRFREEARDVLRAGLASAAWITVDGTGARTERSAGGLRCPPLSGDRLNLLAARVASPPTKTLRHSGRH